ncbi:putative ribonuclease H-like domain-containing protein, partial [Tanacetum coccineum]
MDRLTRKGIKREYSVARTPQQSGVAERRNKTLIEAAKTMLADSKLPTTFGLKQLVLLAMYKIGSYLGKFDGKSDESFFVGYSLSSKAFRREWSKVVHKVKLVQDVENGEPKSAADDQKQD